jgi:hypothetical protein
MLDPPGHKTDSSPLYASGRGPNTRSRRHNRGTRRRWSRRVRANRWWGSRPGRLGLGLAIGGAAAGLLVTALSGGEPGLVLGIFLLAGTAAGALAVHHRAAYVIVPVPPLAYAVAAILAGLIHDHAAGTSHTALAISAAQWIASGFLAMSAATLLALAVATVRWAAERWRRRGQRPAGPPFAPRAPTGP